MPRFHMEQDYLLHNILPDMGLTSLFTNLANLTKLSKDEDLMVSEVSFNLHLFLVFLFEAALLNVL